MPIILTYKQLIMPYISKTLAYLPYRLQSGILFGQGISRRQAKVSDHANKNGRGLALDHNGHIGKYVQF